MNKSFFYSFFLFLVHYCHSQNGRLQFYLDHALMSSPLLKDYQNQAEQNKYDRLIIDAGNKMQVVGSSINTYSPVVKGWGYDAAITNGGAFSTLIGVNKPIPNKKSLATQYENINLQNQSLANNSTITVQEIKRSVIAQYITAYGSLQQLNVNAEIRLLLSREESILKKLTQSNIYRQVDYLAFLVTLQQQELLVKQFRIQYKNDLAALYYQSGISDTATVELQSPDVQLPVLPGIEQTAFLKQFEIDSLKLVNNKNLVDINYRPRVNLFADAGFNSTLAYTPYKNLGASLGISLIVPIYDGKQKYLQYSKIDIAEKTRGNYRSFFITRYQQQVSQLIRQLAETDTLITDISNQLKYTQSLIEVNKKMLETGEARITDYILALNNYINAKNLVTQNTINRLQIINQINYWNR